MKKIEDILVLISEYGILCGTHKPIIEKFASIESALRELAQDAELGRTAMRFVDRAGDVAPGIDDAETICEDFHKAMSTVVDSFPHVIKMRVDIEAARRGA